jgi:hypothetical protein
LWPCHGIENLWFESRQMENNFAFSKRCFAAVGLNQSPVQWLLGLSLFAWGVRLTSHLHLVPRLRMSGDIPLLFLYAFMVWTRSLLLPSNKTLLQGTVTLLQQICWQFYIYLMFRGLFDPSDKGVISSETSIVIYPTIQPNIPEDLNHKELVC